MPLDPYAIAKKRRAAGKVQASDTPPVAKPSILQVGTPVVQPKPPVQPVQYVQQQPKVGFKEVAKEYPGELKKVDKSIINFFTKNTQKLFDTAGKLTGEALAYTDKTVKEQVIKGAEAALADQQRLLTAYQQATDPAKKDALEKSLRANAEDMQRAGQNIKTILPTQATTTLKQIGGQVLGSAAEVASFAKGIKLAKGAVTTAKALAKTGAISSAKYGTAYGAAEALQEDKSLGDTLKSGLKGGATGILAGLVLAPLLGKAGQIRIGGKAAGLTFDPKPVSNILKNAIHNTFQVNAKGVATNGPYAGMQLIKNGKIIPQAAQGRIADIAQQLEKAYPKQGIAERFTALVTPDNVTVAQLEQAARQAVVQPKVFSKGVDQAKNFVLSTEKTKTLFNFIKPRALPTQSGTAKPSSVLDFLRHTESRLQRTGAQGKAIVGMSKEADTVGMVNTGKVTFKLKEAGVMKLTSAENTALGHVLRGTAKPETLTPRSKAVYQTIDAYRKTVPVRARESNVRVRTSKGKTFEFPEGKENYFPQRTPQIADLKRGAIRNEVLENAVTEKRFTSMPEATAALDDYVGFVESNGRKGGDYFANKLVQEGQAKTVTQAKGQMLRFFNPSRQNRYGNLEKARELNFPFFDPNPTRVIPSYVENVERRLAEAQTMGPNLEYVDRALGAIRDPKVKEAARVLVSTMRDANPLEDSALQKLLDAGRRISTVKLNPLSSLTNLSQAVNDFLKTDTLTFVKGITRGATRAGLDFAVESSAIASSSLRQIQKTVAGSGKGVSTYLKLVGFTKSEQLNRIRSANIGWNWVQKVTKKLMSNPHSTFARNELSWLELNADDILKKGGLDHNDLLRAAKVFVDKTQFRSRALDLPVSATRSALGRNLWQFKTFTYQQARFIADHTIGELQRKQPGRFVRNIAVLGTVFPLTGEAIGNIRAAIQGRKRDKRGLERYIEDLAYVGGLPFVLDVVNGFKYGISDILAGPTLSTAFNILENGYKEIAGDGTNASRRKLFQQIPTVGTLAGNRVFPSDAKLPNENTTNRKERIETLPDIGEVKLPLSRFNVDAQDVDLTDDADKQLQQNFSAALQRAYTEVQKLPGWKEKSAGDKKKAFTTKWNKEKAAVRKDWVENGKLNPETIYGPNRKTEGNPNLFSVIGRYAKGAVVDPQQTWSAFSGPEDLRKVRGNAAILERQKFLSTEDKGNKETVVDHIIPLALGGTNDPSNRRTILKSQNQEKSKVEVYLMKELEAGRIKRAEAQRRIKEWVADPTFDYRTGQPATQRSSLRGEVFRRTLQRYS